MKKTALKNFAILTGKHLFWSLDRSLSGLQHMFSYEICFPTYVLGTPILKNIYGRLLLQERY